MEKEKIKRTVILTRGIQGSGKSTWAKTWVAEHPNERLRWNSDDIRNMLGPYSINDWKSREKIVKNMLTHWLQVSLENGYDIVIDNMNLSDNAVNHVEYIVNEYNSSDSQYLYSIEYKYFFTPVDECIRRDSMRPNPIGKNIIRQTWRQYGHILLREQTKQISDKQQAYHNNAVELPNSCIIADMDSTICFNVQGRPYYGNGSHKTMLDDVPNIPVINLIKMYIESSGDNDKVFIITGRTDAPEIKEATQAYVNKYIGTSPKIEILYRPDGECMSGDKMKVTLYNEHIKDKYYVHYAIDDSKKVINAYRELGITVFQPNEGNS